LGESGPSSSTRGGGDEVNQEVVGEGVEKEGEGEASPPKDPPAETETSKKRKVSV